MIALKNLIIIDKKSGTPVYLQITNAIINNIRRGQLKRGTKLPGARELSTLLNIHRKTLQNAYDELMAQGWVEIIPRKGAFIVNELPEIKPIKLPSSGTLHQFPDKTGFSIDENKIVYFPVPNYSQSGKIILDNGLPDIRLAPTDLILHEFKRLAGLNRFKQYYKYGSAQGPIYLLEMLSAFLASTRGLPVSTDNLLITKGAQMGIYMAAQLLIKPKDTVVVGEPGYFAANLTFKQAGANVVHVPVDEFGIDVDAIESLCQKKKVRLVYAIPHHHFPTTVTLTPERRIRLLELAARYKFAIVEDDYDYDFHYHSSPVLPMASLDYHGNVIYTGTITKTLVPAIRLGFVVAPKNFINAAVQLRSIIDRQGDSMMEVAIAELYRNGTITRHIKKVVKLYHERRDSFCTLLKEKLGNHVTFKVPDGGMSVWTKFNDCNLKTVSEKTSKKGLIMSNGIVYNTGTTDYNSARLGFASLNFNEQKEAIDIILQSLL